MSERAYQQSRIAAGLEPDPGLTKPGNERPTRWRYRQTKLLHPEYQPCIAEFDTREEAEKFLSQMLAGTGIIEPIL